MTKSETNPLPSFSEAIDVSRFVAWRRRVYRQMVALRAVAAVLLVAAVCVTGYPLAMQWRSDRLLAERTASAQERVAGWPYPQAEDALRAAREYNKHLAVEGQPILGEASDPFSGEPGASGVTENDGSSSAAENDSEYQSMLDAGSGEMGAIRIPNISVDLPIYHGTGDDALARGAGHLYGTSLPVGGESTHSVLTGHRGLVSAMMFTRLDELVVGDFMYVEVMGETLAYQVDRITVIEPNDTSQLTIVQGEDRLTLMTCTPYGVNTHRLLVSGIRVSIPEPAPDPTDLHDARTVGIWVSVGALALGGSVVMLLRCRKREPERPIRHMSG
ncbi:class C sortase [Bifidobacterium eulemuris]|nr:class C sortase [Bifidobacterium eulemuris]QOL31219.1 class C sortase [Bifidobacterium eulemuris]